MAYDVIGKRYAEAVYSIAKENKTLEKTYEDMSLVLSSLESSEELSVLLENPKISIAEKQGIFTKLFEGEVSKESLNVFSYLIENKRIDYLKEIASSYLEIFYAENEIIEVEATFAIEPSSVQREKLIKKLEKLTAKKVELSTKVDKTILGGGILQIGDKIIDGSLRRQFELLKSNL